MQLRLSGHNNYERWVLPYLLAPELSLPIIASSANVRAAHEPCFCCPHFVNLIDSCVALSEEEGSVLLRQGQHFFFDTH